MTTANTPSHDDDMHDEINLSGSVRSATQLGFEDNNRPGSVLNICLKDKTILW